MSIILTKNSLHSIQLELVYFGRTRLFFVSCWCLIGWSVLLQMYEEAETILSLPPKQVAADPPSESWCPRPRLLPARDLRPLRRHETCSSPPNPRLPATDRGWEKRKRTDRKESVEKGSGSLAVQTWTDVFFFLHREQNISTNLLLFLQIAYRRSGFFCSFLLSFFYQMFLLNNTYELEQWTQEHPTWHTELEHLEMIKSSAYCDVPDVISCSFPFWRGACSVTDMKWLRHALFIPTFPGLVGSSSCVNTTRGSASIWEKRTSVWHFGEFATSKLLINGRWGIFRRVINY